MLVAWRYLKILEPERNPVNQKNMGCKDVDKNENKLLTKKNLRNMYVRFPILIEENVFCANSVFFIDSRIYAVSLMMI